VETWGNIIVSCWLMDERTRRIEDDDDDDDDE